MPISDDINSPARMVYDCRVCCDRHWLCATCEMEPGHENCPCGYNGYIPCGSCNADGATADPHDNETKSRYGRHRSQFRPYRAIVKETK